MCSRAQWRLVLAGALGACSLMAQEVPLPAGSVNFNLPEDKLSPVALVTLSTGESRATPLGAAMVLDLHMSLTLRNTSSNRIHGITLRVVSQEVTMGGKASVSMPSLNVGPGEVFPVHIDQRLMRPTQVSGGPLVVVSLDGVLFQDLSFYGEDKLHSRRIMTAREMEAQRDRQYLKQELKQHGREGLQQAILKSLSRQRELSRLDVRVMRLPSAGSATVASTAGASPRTERFAFLQFPGSHVELRQGSAQVMGNEARAPEVEVCNLSGREVDYVELGWVVRDQDGHEYMAASLPAASSGLSLPAGKTTRVAQDTALLFSRDRKPLNIQSMTGFVSQVQFNDGKVWVPNRQNLDGVRAVLPPSAEEQRLSDLYNRKGIDALVDELKKY